MATVADILILIKSLSPIEQKQLKTILLDNKTKVSGLEQLISEERFTGGLACPHCGCIGHVSRNGHRKNGKQRYICKDCSKSFVANTNSITSGTQKELNVWINYIKCMMNGLSIRKTADICGIHRNTAFLWRHKILDALQDVVENTILEGIVEADETFFPVSYKGNHKKSSFVMPRKAHKRGSSTHTRGLSKQQVCVPCAIDRKGHSLSKIATLGRIMTKDLHLIYDDKIKPESTLCTDKMNSYVRFAKCNNLNLVQLKTGKSVKGIYNIQHINSYHSKLKGFIRGFKGVSTKYLNNYLTWNNCVNMNGSSMDDKVNTLLRTALSTLATVKCRELTKRPAIPLVK
jgi:transposase-like protein